MKVGAKVNLYNFVMRNRRMQLNLTQVELGKITGLGQAFISAVERLEMPQAAQGTINLPEARARSIHVRLKRIADALDMSFEELFPPDYLVTVERQMLPAHFRGTIHLVREIDIRQLPPAHKALQLPSSEDIFERQIEPKEIIRKFLRDAPLTRRELVVIRMRFGLDGYEEGTLDEVARKLGVTRERVRQIEAQALRKLRNPDRSRHLVDYLKVDME